MKTQVEQILDEIKSLRKEVAEIKHPDDDELLTITQIRRKWKAQHVFIMKLIELEHLHPYKLELPGDGRVKGGLRFKRSEINQVLEMFRVEVGKETVEQPDLLEMARAIIKKKQMKE
ncbi:hypothetical protein C0389_00305 [bacterium]|nr:hypothetical protein [bacterium]